VRFFNKKAVILLVAVITVFLLAGSSERDKNKFPFLERVITSGLAPIESAVSKLGFSFRQVGSSAGQLITVYRDNQALKAENEQLRQSNFNVTEIMAENARLRAMLDYKTKAPQFDFVTAKVIARDPGTWTSTIVINKGTADGIAKDMAVVTPQGLVGDVISVFNNTAKVQLILDQRSAVGTLVQRPESRVAGIVEGNAANPLAPRMVNIARDADIIKGDQIITSGFGGIYPKGLQVGQVTDVVNEEGGLLKYAVLKPSVDFDKLEEVLVIVGSREPVARMPVVPQKPSNTQAFSAAPQGAGR
jgi:rod shape-determining protein MreC